MPTVKSLGRRRGRRRGRRPNHPVVATSSSDLRRDAGGLDPGALLSGSVAARPGPGPLAPVHRITIVTAFLGALAYLAWELNQAFSTGAPAAAARALAAAAVAAGLGLYLRNLRARLDAKLRPPPPERRPAA
jgi:hypothetical protein